MDIDSDFETESPRMRSRASSDGSWTRVPAAPALTGPAVVPPAASAAASPRVSTTPAAAFTSTSGTGVEMDWRLLDLKGFLTPTPYSGREVDFPAWKEGFLNIMSALDLDAYMMEAEVRSVPPELAIMTPEQRKMAKMLHIILQKVTQDTGVAALVVKSVRDRNGFMAWRNLCAEIQPRIPDRQTSVLAGLLQPQWGSGPFWPQCLAWEFQIANYEAEAGDRVSDATKVAVLCKWAPTEIRSYLKLAPSTTTQDYKSLRESIRNYLARGTIYQDMGVSHSDTTPMEDNKAMEVDALPQSGKGSQRRKQKDLPPRREQRDEPSWWTAEFRDEPSWWTAESPDAPSWWAAESRDEPYWWTAESTADPPSAKGKGQGKAPAPSQQAP
ncbi:unnamed protein product [Polarella glacialis]|uniref:Uncharacterized protein n=1 Tax=Polarella glacialis TaxID=89957 RepID=A0A813EM35_POLGL|nr:unnamed protein product [Polarella glacialis]